MKETPLIACCNRSIPDPRRVAPRDFLGQAHDLGLKQHNARAYLGAVIGEGILSARALQERGLLTKQQVVGLDDLPALTLEQVDISPKDGFRKLLLRADDGFPIETVVIPLERSGAATVCLSSQVGCVMGCVFCATARMTQRRNLRSWEILDQMRHARAVASAAGLRVTGAVFMGMGEPFLNYEQVIVAAQHLCFPVVNAISGKAITISTVGLIAEMKRFVEESHPFRLSVSIASAFDEKRARLVPIASRTLIREVINVARRYTEVRNDRINLAYVCVSGENVSVEDAIELARVVGDLPIRLDLIDVHDTSGILKPPSDQELKMFRDALSQHLRQPVVRRYSGGADIRAACGTLSGEVMSTVGAVLGSDGF